MVENNRCLTSGCKGYCCEDIFIEITKSERTRLFRKAKKVDSLETLKKVKEEGKNGLYYFDWDRPDYEGVDMYILAIVGPCPNRDSQGGCLKHSERGYAARNFQMGCRDCNEIRVEHGLSPIFIEKPE